MVQESLYPFHLHLTPPPPREFSSNDEEISSTLISTPIKFVLSFTYALLTHHSYTHHLLTNRPPLPPPSGKHKIPSGKVRELTSKTLALIQNKNKIKTTYCNSPPTTTTIHMVTNIKLSNYYLNIWKGSGCYIKDPTCRLFTM